MINTPSDRVQVRQIGDLMHPGACALCGSGNCDRGYVDLGVYYEYEGQVYLCFTCTDQVIETVGGLLPDQALHLQTISEDIAKENREIKEELDGIKHELDSLYTVLANAALNNNPDLFTESGKQVSTEPDSKPANGTGGGKPVTPKPTPKRRPNDSPFVKSGNSQII